MGVPISIRLDEDVRAELEARAASQGIGLATLLRDLATQAAREARRARIHAASARVGGFAEAQSFYADWGTPRTDGG
jgi:hypothetical protein